MTEYRILKGTDLKVSRVCFGTMTFGRQVDEALASRMVNYCLEQGINFFDTANVYQLGMSEQFLGTALRGKRESVVLASKVRGRMGEEPDQMGLSRAAIMRAVDESLQRLQTDYLDIYYFHQPDYDVPIEESLEAMGQLVKSGKVRYPATSNYAGWQVAQILCLTERQSYRPATIAQQMYNLVARGLEQEFVRMAKEFSVSIIAYNPLAGGLLTGKHSIDSITPGTRFDQNNMYLDRYWHEQTFLAIETLKSVARESGRSLVSLSLNWLMHHTAVDSLILGASKLEQLKENLSASDAEPLAPEALEVCDQVWTDLRGTTPIYNR